MKVVHQYPELKVLNLSWQAPLPEDFSILYNEIANSIGNQYNHMIDELSSSFGDDLDWWFSSVASRDVLMSPLFHYCICILLLEKIEEANMCVECCVLDSKELYDILINKYPNSIFKLKKGANDKNGLLVMLREMKSLGFRFLMAKLSGIKIKPNYSQDNLILIDTFVNLNEVSANRYYPKLIDSFVERDESLYFVPEIDVCSHSDIYYLYKTMRKTGRYLLKEDFLRISDYFYTFLHIFRIKKLIIPEIFFENYNFSKMIKAEVNKTRSLRSTCRAFLNYHFAKRVKEQQFKPKTIIDWFENQVIDKGWNKGFNTFFPESLRRGYFGLIPLHNMWRLWPTNTEKKADMLPDSFGIMGEGLSSCLNVYLDCPKIVPAPAFRYQYLYQHTSIKKQKQVTILLALPIFLDQAVSIIKLYLNFVLKEYSLNTKTFVRLHPDTKQTDLLNYFDNWPKSFSFSNCSINDDLHRSHIVIATASSVCIEALAMGVRVLPVANFNGLTFLPVSNDLTNPYLKVCNTQIMFYETLYDFIQDAKIQDKLPSLKTKKILHEFFNEFSDDLCSDFLCCTISEGGNEEI